MTEAAAPTPAPNDQQCLKFGCAALHYKTLATTTREELEQLNVALIFLVTVAVVFFLALIVVWFVAGNKLSCNPVNHDDDDDDHGHGDQKNKSKQQQQQQQQTPSKRVKLIGLKASQLNGRMGWTTRFIEEGEGKGRFKVLLDGTDEPREGNFWCVFFVVFLCCLSCVFALFCGCCSLTASFLCFFSFFLCFFLSLNLHQAEKLCRGPTKTTIFD